MSKNKYVLKNKRKFFGFISFISIIAFTLIYTASVSAYKEPQFQSIVVQSGDTLWSIAERYSNNSNIRKYIYNVKTINNMDSGMLYENTAILIPIED